MMVLITYDVDTTHEDGARRLRRVAKACMNYGLRVQNSVFECVLDEAHFVRLRSELNAIIDKDNDSVRFYFLGNNWERRIEQLGLHENMNAESTLII